MNKFLIKRLFDIVFSISSLIILSPIFLIIAILIKFDTTGEVFFRQERLGFKGKKFEIIKFRTMITDAEQLGTGLKVSKGNDPRITKIGSFLRKTSLDELPQLFNVLKGEMSIVGPRPPVTYHPYKGIDNYPTWAKRRFDMRPGITGLAQVKVRNSASWLERIEIDINYIENFSCVLDLKIIYKTVTKILKPESIYLEDD